MDRKELLKQMRHHISVTLEHEIPLLDQWADLYQQTFHRGNTWDDAWQGFVRLTKAMRDELAWRLKIRQMQRELPDVDDGDGWKQ